MALTNVDCAYQTTQTNATIQLQIMGPCMSNEDFRNSDCKYRTFLKDYKISNKGTREEKVFIDYHTMEDYRERYSQWFHLKNLRVELRIWRPCEYFDQLNIASASSHSILNYPIFLAFLPNRKVLPSRELLVLDEAHLLVTEIVRFRGHLEYTVK